MLHWFSHMSLSLGHFWYGYFKEWLRVTILTVILAWMSYFLFVLEINRQVNSSTLAATTWNSSSVLGNAFSSTRISCLRVFKHAMIISICPYSWHGINCGRTARKYTVEMTAQRELSLSPSRRENGDCRRTYWVSYFFHKLPFTCKLETPGILLHFAIRYGWY